MRSRLIGSGPAHQHENLVSLPGRCLEDSISAVIRRQQRTLLQTTTFHLNGMAVSNLDCNLASYFCSSSNVLMFYVYLTSTAWSFG